MSNLSSNARKHLTKNPLKRYFLNRFYISVKDIVRKINPRSILDCGCGEGIMTQILHQVFPSVIIVGIDISEDMLASARVRCPNVEFQVADIKQLPFDTAFFDLVVCAEVLEHVDGATSALAEICRISAGHVLVTVPREPWFWTINLFGLNHLRTFGNVPGHINHWNMTSFRELVSEHMKILSIRSSFPWILAHGKSLTGRRLTAAHSLAGSVS